MLDIVAADQNELPLAVEAERVDEAEPRLASSPAGNPQPMGKHDTIDNGQCDQDSDPAGRQNGDLDDAAIGERKIIQPLHALSNASAADRAGHITTRRRGNGRISSSRPRVFGQPWTRQISRLLRVGASPIAARDKPRRLHNKTQSR
jgi:hypothetical protein